MRVTLEPSGSETVMLPWWTWPHGIWSATASINATWNCIMHRERHLLILSVNAAKFSGPWAICDGPGDSGNVLCAKDVKGHPYGYQRKVQKQSLWWYGGASVPTAWVICRYLKVPLMPRLMLEFCRDISYHQDDDFSQELHVYFSRTMPGLILHELQDRGFICIECVCLTGQPVSYWKCRAHHEEENQTTETTDCRAAQVLYTPRKGKKIHLQNCNNLFSFPKRLQSVIKRKGYPKRLPSG